MCYERRSFTSNEQKKNTTVGTAASERSPRHEEVVRSLLRDAPGPAEKISEHPKKDYLPAK